MNVLVGAALGKLHINIWQWVCSAFATDKSPDGVGRGLLVVGRV